MNYRLIFEHHYIKRIKARTLNRTTTRMLWIPRHKARRNILLRRREVIKSSDYFFKNRKGCAQKECILKTLAAYYKTTSPRSHPSGKSRTLFGSLAYRHQHECKCPSIVEGSVHDWLGICPFTGPKNSTFSRNFHS